MGAGGILMEFTQPDRCVFAGDSHSTLPREHLRERGEGKKKKKKAGVTMLVISEVEATRML